MHRTIKGTPTEATILGEAFQAFSVAQDKLVKLFTMFAESHGVPQSDLISVASNGTVVVDVKESATPVRPPVNPAARKKRR